MRFLAGLPTPFVGEGSGELNVVPVPLRCIRSIASMRISINADLRPVEQRKAHLIALKVCFVGSAEKTSVEI